MVCLLIIFFDYFSILSLFRKVFIMTLIKNLGDLMSKSMGALFRLLQEEEGWKAVVMKNAVALEGIDWEDLVYHIKHKFDLNIFMAVDTVRTFARFCEHAKNMDEMIDVIKKNYRGKEREALLYLASKTEWRD